MVSITSSHNLNVSNTLSNDCTTFDFFWSTNFILLKNYACFFLKFLCEFNNALYVLYFRNMEKSTFVIPKQVITQNKLFKLELKRLEDDSSNLSVDQKKLHEQLQRAKFNLPLHLGWRRELVFRASELDISKREKCDIYYIEPDGKKFRSWIEINKFLQSNSNSQLAKCHFSFGKHKVSYEISSREIVRVARQRIAPVQLENKQAHLKKSTISEPEKNDCPQPSCSLDTDKQQKHHVQQKKVRFTDSVKIMSRSKTPPKAEIQYKDKVTVKNDESTMSSLEQPCTKNHELCVFPHHPETGNLPPIKFIFKKNQSCYPLILEVC